MSVYQKAGWVSALLLYFTCSCRAQVTQPLSLDQAMSEAVASNLNLIAERYNLSVAEARIITARLRPNPIFTVEGDHLDLLGTGYNKINQAVPTEYSVRTHFILERGGKRETRSLVDEDNQAVRDVEVHTTCE